jgi:hypothetical protein
MSVNPERVKLVGAMRDHQSFLVEKNQQIMDALSNSNKKLFVAVLKNPADPDDQKEIYFRSLLINEMIDCNNQLRSINPLFVTGTKADEPGISEDDLDRANLVRVHFVSLVTSLPEDWIKGNMTFRQVNNLFWRIREQSDVTKEDVEDLGKFRKPT